MSQYGALGRAQAGQMYDQILAHYYNDTTLGTIDPKTIVRVQLASSHIPTGSSPARISARYGTWQSSSFTDGSGKPIVFPADSYIQMVDGTDGWEADVYDSSGNKLDSALATDVTIKPVDTATRLEMKWRDSLPKYILYRGTMRLLVNGDGVQCINAVVMDDYLKGVVPAEMPPLWPVEAVKAQAVASRGYAYVRLRPDRTYDVVPTAGNQVYGGVGIENNHSNAAIDATAEPGRDVRRAGRQHVLLHGRRRLHGEQRVRLGGQQRQGHCRAHPVPARRTRLRPQRRRLRRQGAQLQLADRHPSPGRSWARCLRRTRARTWARCRT